MSESEPRRPALRRRRASLLLQNESIICFVKEILFVLLLYFNLS
jgi:hypothetical protein